MVARLAETPRLAGLFLRSRAVAGAIPTGARQRGPRAVGGEFSPMGCFFGESRSDLGWLALLLGGEFSQKPGGRGYQSVAHGKVL